MIYKCECGREFDKPNSLNGHKSHCEIHLKLCNKLYVKDLVNNSLKIASERGCKNHSINCKLNKQKSLDEWISEKHICEKCGKVMTEKFGSGRFCSRSCANSRIKTDEIKQKISNSINITYRNIIEDNKKSYYMNPIYCPVCGKVLPYELRYHKLCSKKCYSEFFSLSAKKAELGGLTRSSGGRSKRGWYKGYWCDSTWELAWIIYNVDHNIEFKRCPHNIYYLYTYNGKEYKYYPDFILPDGSLVEIKNYYSEQVKLKIDSVTDRKLSVLYRSDLEYAFNYVKEKYKVSKLEDLYD